jgi:anti-sigma28 factor (negative regulator of flagellin synthesis)
VDFEGAARRLVERSERVNGLKEQVKSGTYRADAGETARAMERRSEA